MKNQRPLWLGSMIALIATHLAIAALLANVTGGREIGDDAPHLMAMIRNPLALFSNYQAAGYSNTWGSFPPLLPLFFGLLIRPWLAAGSDFWAIRLGALCWSILALLGFHWLASGVPAVPRRRLRTALWLFALSPPLIGGSAVLPEEEAYVCLFGMLLFAVARQSRWSLLPLLFAATAIAGKYFLLALAIPLALASPRPLRDLTRFVAVPIVVLAAYIIYHQLRFGLMPIFEYELSPAGTISVWALLWNLGFQPPPQLIQTASTLTTGCLVLAFCWLARRRKFPLVVSVAGTLWIVLLSVSVAFPPYLLWNLPFLLIVFAMLESAPLRWVHAGLIYLWGGIAYTSKLFRGVHLTLAMDRSGGKDAVADLLARALGSDFPYHAAQALLTALCVAIGITYVALLWMTAARLSGERDKREPHRTQAKLGDA